MIRRLLAATLIACGISLPVLAGEITINSALYGANGTTCDAREAVAKACAGQDGCRIGAGNALCGDPLRGTPKQLTVVYNCGLLNRTAIIREGEDRRLDCNEPETAAARIAVDTAVQVAPDGRSCIAKYGMVHLCDARGCLVRNNTNYCPDKDLGRDLRLDMVAGCADGPRSDVHLQPGQSITFCCGGERDACGQPGGN